MAKSLSIKQILPLFNQKTKEQLEKWKRKISKEQKINTPSNSFLLKIYHSLLKEGRIKRNLALEKILRKRPIRSLSGVVNISVLTKPYPCPGQCIFCPQEKGLPKSYLSKEPAVERAKTLSFSPKRQVAKRIEDLKNCGHNPEKIELRIIGGTFSYYPKDYQKYFIQKIFESVNQKKSKNLKEAQKINERSKNKIVSLSIETRPDYINEKEIKNLRTLGVTKVEIGVQTIFDDILSMVKRGHSIKETIRATKLLKDAGFKVSYQLMPNLPGSDLKRDFLMFLEIFQNQDFKPDYLKIYPLMLIKNTKLFYLIKKKKIFLSLYSEKELKDLIKRVKTITPFWVRIERIVRDFPLPGSQISNLRQKILQEMKEEKKACHCLRCREIKEKYNPEEKIYLFREDYFASDGKEIFLSFETKKREKVLSFLRLRIPSFYFQNEKPLFPVLKDSALLREIKTLGELTGLEEKKISPQHQGLGKKLIKEAEKISKKEFYLKKISVISGVGARNYFRKLGFKLSQTYMVKNL